MINKWFVLSLILALFLLTRIYHIQEIPSSLYWDEASIGYNAYSIIKTGHDEWGKFFPLHFRAFGEFKLPIYIYTVSLSEILLGNSVLAVRLPAVIFSLISLLFVYKLSLEIFKGNQIALLSALFFTISPWLFIFSRTGYEATAGLAFYLTGIYFFIAKYNKPWKLFISITCFILSLYSYNSFLIITPLTLLILVPFSLENLRKLIEIRLWEFMLAAIFLVVSIVPIIRFFKYEGGVRYQQVRVQSVAQIPKNYLSHFSSNFLFSGDNNPRSQMPGFGQLYYFDSIFILLGIIYILKSKQKRYYLAVVLALLGPIPASLTKESPHALRSLSAAPFLLIISALGANYLIDITKKKLTLYILICLSLLLYGNYIVRFIKDYNIVSAKDWQYEYKKAFESYRINFNKYEHILVTDSGAQPYIFSLYYLNYDPNIYLSTLAYNSYDKWGFSKVRSFGNFIFGPISDLNLPEGKVLIFASSKERLDRPILNSIKYPNGEIALYVYEINN